MKIFWWQGDLHAEPETAEEGKAINPVMSDRQFREAMPCL
jgi:hypothetical protein